MVTLARLFSVLVTLNVLVWPAAGAGPLDAALAAEKKGDWNTYFRIIKSEAERGNPEAQFRLGRAHITDFYAKYGIKKSRAEKMRWLRLAATKCHANASFYLGNDAWVKPRQDFVEAYVWYTVGLSLAQDKRLRKRIESNRDFLVKQKRLNKNKRQKARALAKQKIGRCKR